VNIVITSPQYTGAEMGAVTDAWLADVAFQDTQNTVTVDDSAKRLTLEGVHVTHTVTHTGDRMADFGLSGTQLLLDNCSSDGTGEWPLVTQGEVSGPIVALNFTSGQAAGIGPHQRWAVGLLTDNASLPNAPNNPDGGATGISYSDRGNHGSGQGWAMGWGVAWNVTTPYLVVQQPPGGQNWCIGCVGAQITATEAGSGKPVPDGVFESLGTKVTPNSLYLAQLCDRLGPAALTAIGYTPMDCAVPGTGGPGGDDASTGVPPGGDDASPPVGGDDASPGDDSGSAPPPPGHEGGAGSSSGTSGGGSSGSTGDAFARSQPAGCGCTLAGLTRTRHAWLLALGALIGVGARRRRKRGDG
jgi:hypothetical protein